MQARDKQIVSRASLLPAHDKREREAGSGKTLGTSLLMNHSNLPFLALTDTTPLQCGLFLLVPAKSPYAVVLCSLYFVITDKNSYNLLGQFD